MGLEDLLVTAGITAVAFLTGFWLRGLLPSEGEEEWAAAERPSSRYEPPGGRDRL